MTSSRPTTLIHMMSDVSMTFAHADVPSDLDTYIMTRVREKMVDDHGCVLIDPLDASEYERTRKLLRDELERSIAHKERQARDTLDSDLDDACKDARTALGEWIALG